MARFSAISDAAAEFERSTRTIENWIGAGLIHGYRGADRRVYVDLDEIEVGFKLFPGKMRDGRRPFGPNAKIVALPIEVEK